jgi:hypothetical protein
MSIQSNFPNIAPSLNLDFANVKALDPRVTFTRASTATYYDANGVLQTAAANVARFDHNPTTGESLGLLIEEQRTNLLTYSSEFDNAAWSKSNASVSANLVVAPDGAVSADKLVDTAASTNHSVNQAATTVAATSYTWSCYAKSAERTQIALEIYNGGTTYKAIFSLVDGSFVSSTGTGTYTVTPLAGGWFRFAITGTASTTTTNAFVYTASGGTTTYLGDGYSGIYIWGAQLEVGAFPTSYIPTVAAQVTRSADAASMTGVNFSSWYRQDEGTVYIETEASPNTNTVYFDASDGVGTSNNFYIDHNSGNIRNVTFSGGVAVSVLSFGAVGASYALNKLGCAYKVNDFAAVRNAGSPLTDASGAVPVNPSQFRFGSSANGIASTYLSGHIRRISYYPKRLTNTQLQALTA